jgi:Cu(I)/Ag(I) efflux system membrane protein CusA/SilA
VNKEESACFPIAYERWRSKERMANYAHLTEAAYHGAVRRIRPKMMSVMMILWSTSAGADVMGRIAAPMIGGVLT